MEQINECPVCGSISFSHFKNVTDHFLSKEQFQIVQCADCSFLFTNPRPGRENISRYYQSDEYLSHSKKSKGLIGFIYDTVRNISLKKKFRLISQYKSGKKLLDIGSGTGEFLNYMKKKGWDATGIEPAEQPRKFAAANYKIEIYNEDVIDSLPEKSFDLITMWHVLEHVPDVNLRISQVKKILAKDGLLLIALPNHLSWDAEHYGESWAAWDVPRHFYHFNEHTFSLLASKHNLEIISIQPMKFDAYYISLLSEKYKSKRTCLSAAFLNGLRSNVSAKRNANNYSSIIFLLKPRNI